MRCAFRTSLSRRRRVWSGKFRADLQAVTARRLVAGPSRTPTDHPGVPRVRFLNGSACRYRRRGGPGMARGSDCCHGSELTCDRRGMPLLPQARSPRAGAAHGDVRRGAQRPLDNDREDVV